MQAVTLNLNRIKFCSQLTAEDVHIEATSERSVPRGRSKVPSADITDKLRIFNVAHEKA